MSRQWRSDAVNFGRSMELSCFKRFAFLIFLVLCARASNHAAYAENPQHSIVVTLSTDRKTYTVGQNIAVRYGITNVGVEPVYVSPYLDLVSSPVYGFYISILDTKGASAAQGVVAADPGPDYEKNRKIVAEIQRDWVLLRPGYFYGHVTTLSFPPRKPGKYKLKGTYRSNHLTDKDVGPVSQLKYLERGRANHGHWGQEERWPLSTGRQFEVL
jgi:hypothetical protein